MVALINRDGQVSACAGRAIDRPERTHMVVMNLKDLNLIIDTPFCSVFECKNRSAHPSSPRTRGPMTPSACDESKASTTLVQTRRHGVWVPAFAGTTNY